MSDDSRRPEGASDRRRHEPKVEPVDNSGPFVVVRTPVMYQAGTFGPPRVMTAEKAGELRDANVLVWELAACPTRAAAEAARRLLESR